MFLNRIAEGGDSVRYMVPGDRGYAPVTYRQVGDAAREIGLGLMALGCREGPRGDPRDDAPGMVSCGHRVDLGGYVTVPIYPSNLPDQVEYILAHSRARAVFVEDESQYNKVAGPVPPASPLDRRDDDRRRRGKGGAATLSALRERGRPTDPGTPGPSRRARRRSPHG